jgi:hypothetical protein
MTVEVYSILKGRRADSACDFLARFLVQKTPSQVDYPVPHFSDAPEQVFTREEEVFEYLERNPCEAYSFYWNEGDSKSPIDQGMLFYTKDAMMILGLDVDPDLEVALRYTRELRDFSGCDAILYRLESPPPNFGWEFEGLARSEKPDLSRLIEQARV